MKREIFLQTAAVVSAFVPGAQPRLIALVLHPRDTDDIAVPEKAKETETEGKHPHQESR